MRRRLVYDELEIDPVRREVVVDGQPLHTTRKEFELLHLLASNPGRVFTRGQLLETVWGYVWTGASDTVTVHIRRLRAKIERDAVRAAAADHGPRRGVQVRAVNEWLRILLLLGPITAATVRHARSRRAAWYAGRAWPRP